MSHYITIHILYTCSSLALWDKMCISSNPFQFFSWCLLHWLRLNLRPAQHLMVMDCLRSPFVHRCLKWFHRVSPMFAHCLKMSGLWDDLGFSTPCLRQSHDGLNLHRLLEELLSMAWKQHHLVISTKLWSNAITKIGEIRWATHLQLALISQAAKRMAER